MGEITVKRISWTKGISMISMTGEFVAASVQVVSSLHPSDKLINSVKSILIREAIGVVTHYREAKSVRIPVAAVSSLAPLSTSLLKLDFQRRVQF